MKGEQVCSSRPRCWELFTCSVAVPEPVLPTFPNLPQRAGLLLLLEELLSSLADTFILLCECDRAAALHFMHSDLRAKRQPPRIGLHNPHLMPSTFN